MDMRKFGFLFVCVIALSVLMMRGSGERQRAEGLFLGFRDTAIVASPELNEDLMERIWLYCGLDFMDTKEVLRSSGSSYMEDLVCDSTETNPNSRFFLKSGNLETVTFLSLQIKHELLSCLSRQNFHFNVPGDDDRLINMYMEYLESLLGCSLLLRRHLADQPLQATSPASAPTPGPSSVSASSPSPGVEVPSFGPAPSSDLAAASAPAPDNQSSGDTILPPNSYNLTPGAAPVSPSKKPNNSKRSVIIAVVLTAAGTSLMAACIFCCYHKCCRDSNDSTYGQRDESPLMTLSLSDFSGLSPKSFGQDTIHKEKIGGLSVKTDPGQNDHVLSFDVSSDGTRSSDIPSGNSISSTEMSNISSNAFEPKPPPPPPVMLPSIKKIAPSPPAPPPLAPPPPPPVMPPIKKVGPSPSAPPPPLPNSKPGPQHPPPPPPKGALPPHLPQGGLVLRVTQPSPLGPNHSGDAASAQRFGAEDDANAPKEKTKLKPFFWDKVRANPDQSMVWHQIRSGSFQFNEETIEMLFGYNSANRNKCEGKKESSSNDPSTQNVQLINPKKSQNLAISLKALNVKTEEVCDALMEGNNLPTDLLKTLLRMSPTTDEELKLRLYSGNLSLLGPAERFLKVVVGIPFAFKRIDALLFMASLQEDALVIKESFATIEVACKELRSSRLFLKLLEAVLKTGNRMNDGTFRGGALAFRLDTLLKLSDVKGTDGKTTLLHFVVQEIIRSEGMRAACSARESGSTASLMTSGLNSNEGSPRESGDYYCNLGLKVISGLSNELENVKKAAGLDADALTNMVVDFAHRLVKTKEFLNKDMGILDVDSGFYQSLTCFVEHAEADITFLLEEEKRIKSLVKSTTNYFHGNAGKDEGLRLFVIVRDFLGMLDKACKEVRESAPKASRTPNIRDNSPMARVPDPRQLLFPAIRDRRVEYSSSDDEES
ncbi:formin-like protein 5 [Phoenix dactylifera]|uniref:Formin-like protein n=1 Tax=Phoenix dactylifera TaxID=42345 RepID=A0A8B7C3H5_PHODC|nr:formin-like protein 5 [Phoenix dactylifera]